MYTDYIIDDLRYTWRYSALRGKIYCVEAEQEMHKNFEDTWNNGYYCDSFEDGIRLLIEYGYISEESK